MDKGIRRGGWPAGWAWGLAQLGHGPEGGGFSFFSVLVLIPFLIFSSVLIQFKIFMYFIKLCLLHHNYLCNI